MINIGKFAGLWSGLYRGTTEWEILSSGKWTVPVTGWYEIDIRGGGGGGGNGSRVTVGSSSSTRSGGPGGNSRQVEKHLLKKGDTYAITIGTGGGHSDGAGPSESGNASSFGDLITIPGGGGGTDGSASGGYNGTAGTSHGNATPGIGSPGRGGNGGYYVYYEGSGWYGGTGSDGQDGGCFVTYLGQGATG